jgi:coenzyme F420-reducing hydrogenase alpha subunit
MSKKIVFQKATRIEGNANIQIDIDSGKVNTARFLVHEFRGFEGFLRGIRVENVPHMVSRICGLCSSSHQIASIRAIEEALSVNPPRSVEALRNIILLGEWINSHALSYFFLTMPDFVGVSGGVFELMQTHPEIVRDAFALRNAGLSIVRILGRRTSHPVTIGIGRFNIVPAETDIEEIRKIALDILERTARLINQVENIHVNTHGIHFPAGQQVNFVAYDGFSGQDSFSVYSQTGEIKLRFSRDEFMENISELRTDWSLAKFPYLSNFGFPAGIMLVGPLSRSFQDNSILSDTDLTDYPLVKKLRDRTSLTLESYDVCRLLEIFWSAKRILSLLGEVDLTQMSTDTDLKGSGKGIGVLEAPRGILMHSYLINQGRIKRMRLMVATQFNNAYINLLLRDLAEKHLDGDNISQEGEKLIGRCVRIFDPCLSCATH